MVIYFTRAPFRQEHRSSAGGGAEFDKERLTRFEDGKRPKWQHRRTQAPCPPTR